MATETKERINFSSNALGQMDLLRPADRREVRSKLKALDFDRLGNSKTDESGRHKIDAGRYTVVFRILDGELNVITLFAND